MSPPSPASHQGSIIITGTNSGLGLATVSKLLSSPQSSTHHSIFTVRNPSSPACADLHKLLAQHKDKSTEVVSLNLSTLAGVRSFTDEVNKRVSSREIPPIRYLLLNAAVQQVNGQCSTNDGYEQTFAVNYLANFLLVLRLLQSLDKGRDRGEGARIVIVSSWTHDPSHPWNVGFPEKAYKDPELIAHPPKPDDPKNLYNAGMHRYGLSKTLMLMFMFQLQSRLNESPSLSKISILCFDPQGMPDTGLLKESPLFIRLMVNGLMRIALPILNVLWPSAPFQTSHTSAAGLLYSAFDTKTLGEQPKCKNVGFKLKFEETNPECREESNQKELWAKSLEFAGVKEGETILENWR